MTATVTPIRPATNGTRRPVRIEVDRSELVGFVMDAQALAETVRDANGYSLGIVRRLPFGPWRTEMERAHHDTHDALVALLKELRMAAGRWDKDTPHTEGA